MGKHLSELNKINHKTQSIVVQNDCFVFIRLYLNINKIKQRIYPGPPSIVFMRFAAETGSCRPDK